MGSGGEYSGVAVSGGELRVVIGVVETGGNRMEWRRRRYFSPLEDDSSFIHPSILSFPATSSSIYPQIFPSLLTPNATKSILEMITRFNHGLRDRQARGAK